MICPYNNATYLQKGASTVSTRATGDDAPRDDTARRVLNLLFILNASSRPFGTDEIVTDSDLGYGSGNRTSDKRKFKRDRERLAELGVIVREVRGDGSAETEESRWEIDRERTHAEAGAISADDAALVAAAVEQAFSLDRADPDRWPLRRAYRKLLNACGAPAAQAPAPQEVASDSESPAIQAIWEGYAQRRPLTFTYRDAKGTERTRTADIYGIFSQGGNSYFVGRDHGADAVRTFRADRVVSARRIAASAARYAIPADFHIDGYRFQPFDFSENAAMAVTFSFPLGTPEDEVELITKSRGELVHDGERDRWLWRVEVHDIEAAASLALRHATAGMKPVDPPALLDSWRSHIERALAEQAVAAHA